MLFYDFEVFSQDWLVVIKDTDTRSTNKILNDPDALRETKIIFGLVIIVGPMTNIFLKVYYLVWIQRK